MATTSLNPDGSPKSFMQQAAEQMARQNAGIADDGTPQQLVGNPAPVTAAQPLATPNQLAAPATPTSSPLAPPAGAAGAAAVTPSATTITPTLGTFDESNGAAGRVAQITAADSPLMQLAATRGRQAAAARGLTNSTLGIESAQNAVLQAATPLATTDAGLYQQAKLANQAASNAASTTSAQLTESARQADTALAQRIAEADQQKEQFAATLGMQGKDLDLRRDTLTESQRQALDTINLQRAQLAQQQGQFEATRADNQGNFNAELGQRQAQFESTQRQQLVMQAADNDTKTQLANTESTWRQAIQNNTNISQAWGTLMTNLQAIQNNSGLDSDAKKVLLQNNLDSFAAFASFWSKATGGTAPDISSLLSFTTTGAPNIPDRGNPGNNGSNVITQPWQPPGGNEYGGGGAGGD